MMRLPSLLAAVLLATGPADAATLALCADEQPHPPFFFPDRDGAVPILVRMAAVRAGIDLTITRLPITRCLAEIRAGRYDGYPAINTISPVSAEFIFPVRAGHPDSQRASMLSPRAVFRPVGSKLQWDGRQFSNVRTTILSANGQVKIPQWLAAHGIKSDANGRNAEMNFLKLLAGRGDAAIEYRSDGMALLADPRFAGKIEVLPQLFDSEYYYLGVSKQAWHDKRATVLAMWEQIGKLHKDPAYQEAIKDLPAE